jgi:hypothetical protein
MIETITLKWSVINNLYSSIIGKCLFLLSSVSLFTTIPLSIYVISTRNMAFALLGAVVLSLSYIFYKIRIPEIINQYNEISYYKFLLDQKKRKSLDLIHEFSLLEDNDNISELDIFTNKNYRIHPFTTIEKYEDILGEDRSLYALTLIKYSFLDNSSPKARIAISLFFYIGCLLLYFPAIIRIATVIIKGVV